jgi:hypothetical protein
MNLYIYVINSNQPSHISYIYDMPCFTPHTIFLGLCSSGIGQSVNMYSMLVTLLTFHLEISPLKETASLNMQLISVTLLTSYLEISPLKETANWNIDSMVVTLLTFHLLISPLKADTASCPS